MTNRMTIAISLALATLFVGCAVDSEGGVDVVTAELDDQYFELVEMRNEDVIEVEVAYSVGQAEEIARSTFEWPVGAPTPVELTELLASMDARLLEHVTPIDGPSATVSVTAVWPRLLQEASLLQQLDLSTGTGCSEVSGFSDCLQAN